MNYRLSPLGDQAVTIEVGSEITMDTHQQVQAIARFLEKHRPEWLLDYTPAYTSVTLFYDAWLISKFLRKNQLPYQFVCTYIDSQLTGLLTDCEEAYRLIEIPVCYGADFGPDLDYVANYNQLSAQDVINIHVSAEYIVYMLGFAPGFPYLGGMNEKISAPRKAVPRLRIPSRSVGIAGKQTGIYPLETPGGWQIIGQTPVDLFLPGNQPPTLLQPGDHIRFFPISRDQYLNWGMDL